MYEKSVQDPANPKKKKKKKKTKKYDPDATMNSIDMPDPFVKDDEAFEPAKATPSKPAESPVSPTSPNPKSAAPSPVTMKEKTKKADPEKEKEKSKTLSAATYEMCGPMKQPSDKGGKKKWEGR